MPRSYVSLYVHYTWSTKHREEILTPAIIQRMREMLMEIAQEKGFWIDTFNGVEDHVHVLVSLKSTQTVAWVAQQLKGITGRRLNEEKQVPGELTWQEGYGAFSESRYRLELVRNYIRRQAEHHQAFDFTEELKRLEAGTLPTIHHH